MKVLISEKLSPHKYKTPEGYLICVDAVLARTGKQTYKRSEIFDEDDNTEIEVNRLPEEVFSEQTLASFENKPITVEHPDEDVNSTNFKDYSVGFVRDVHKGTIDGQDVILGTLVIQDDETIREIESGEHTDLSCGYDCDIIDEENPQQRNIRGNHVALCECGRAGNARIVDSVKDDINYLEKKLKEIFDKYNYNRDEAIAEVNSMKHLSKDDIATLTDWVYDLYSSRKDSCEDEIKSYYTQRKGVIYVYIDHKLVGKFSSKKEAIDAGYDLDNSIVFNANIINDDYFGKPGRRFTIGETVKFHEYGFNSWVEATVKAVKGDRLDLRTKYGFNEVDVPSEYVEKIKDSIKDDYKRYGVTPKRKWKSSKKIELYFDDLNEARYRKNSLQNSDGIDYVIVDLETTKIVDTTEGEIKEYMKKTGFSYIDAKRALEEDDSEFVEKMRKAQYDNVVPTKEASNDKVIYTLQSNIDSNLYFYIGKQYAVKDGQFTYNKFKLEGTSPEQLKNDLISSGWKLVNRGYITTIDCKDDYKEVYRIKNYNNKWYYEISRSDGFTKLIGPYSTEEEAKVYFKKHKPTEKLIDEETPYEEVTKNLEKNIKDDSDLSLLKQYFSERQPNKKMELRNKLKSMNYREGVSGVNSRELMWVSLNGKNYEVKNLSTVKPLNITKDSIKDNKVISEWKKVHSSGMPIKSAIIETKKGYTFYSAIPKEDMDFYGLEAAERYAKSKGYTKDSYTKLSDIINAVKAIKTIKRR